jgi:hypothetical protein
MTTVAIGGKIVTRQNLLVPLQVFVTKQEKRRQIRAVSHRSAPSSRAWGWRQGQESLLGKSAYQSTSKAAGACGGHRDRQRQPRLHAAQLPAQACKDVAQVTARAACAAEINRGIWAEEASSCVCPGTQRWDPAAMRCER